MSACDVQWVALNIVIQQLMFPFKLRTHLESANPECTTKAVIFMKHKLEAGTEKL
jgi:hypothetical protein